MDYWSNLLKAMWGISCPNCQLVIFKNGGCPYMVCTGCKFEFCWFCLGQTETHVHFKTPEAAICPSRALYLYSTIIVLANLVNLKVIVRWPSVFELEQILSFYLAFLLIPVVVNLGYLLNGYMILDYWRTGRYEINPVLNAAFIAGCVGF
jgi:hypothetical protein